VIGSIANGALTLVLTAPWWVTVMTTHGIAPFLAARASGGTILSDLPSAHEGILMAVVHYALRITGEGHFPLILILAIIGAVWSLADRRTLILPVWWVTILVLDARAGFTYAMVPVSMLAGLAVVHVVWPVVAPRMRDHWWLPRQIALAGFTVLVGAAIVAAASRRFNRAADTQILTALAPADRAAMQWVAQHTAPAARVLVLTDGPWQIDKTSEWFPVLAGRVSVATVQGTEWLQGAEFQHSITRQSRLRACANGAASCLDSLSQDPTLAFTYVYAPTGPSTRCCDVLRDSLKSDARYQTIYAGEGATLFSRR
jgi:hypothetical protein